MNTSLSKNLRTHIVYVKTMDGKDTEEIQITKEQYDMISEDIKLLKYNDFYKIEDVDNKKVLYEGQVKDILRFKEKNLNRICGYKVICGYGNKHDLINGGFNCDCYQKYRFFSIDLKIWARDNKKSMYPQDLTIEDKRQCYLDLKKQGKI